MSESQLTTHEEQLAALSRIEGQVRGIQKMITKQDYCIDIITQIQAVRAALHSLSRKILRKHMQHCVTEAIREGNQQTIEEKLNEILQILKRMD